MQRSIIREVVNGGRSEAMPHSLRFRRKGWRAVLGTVLVAVLALIAWPASALAGGGGNVLPPTAQPRGYSLQEMAAATAVFNTSGFQNRRAATEPSLPFQILYTSTTNPSNTFVVRPGTMFYVPIVYSDDSPPILGDFPNVNDAKAVSDYFFNPEQLGAEYIEVIVDGRVTTIGPEYVVGAQTPGLPSGGNLYTVAAVFLTPLSKGVHTVTIRARFTGAAIGGVFEFENTYRVVVR